MKVNGKTPSKQESQPKEEFTEMVKMFTKIMSTFPSHNNDRQSGMAKVKIHTILKKLMTESEISARQLSKETGIPTSTLSTYLSGKKASYNPEHLVKLASFFGVSLDYLLKGEVDTLKILNSLSTDEIFSGWLKVKIERAIPGKKED